MKFSYQVHRVARSCRIRKGLIDARSRQARQSYLILTYIRITAEKKGEQIQSVYVEPLFSRYPIDPLDVKPALDTFTHWVYSKQAAGFSPEIWLDPVVIKMIVEGDKMFEKQSTSVVHLRPWDH